MCKVMAVSTYCTAVIHTLGKLVLPLTVSIFDSTAPALPDRLFIGLGVGIPFLLGLVILVILLYCCWSRYHRKRMTILTEMYIQQVAAASASDDAQNNGAPPGYTAVDASKAETNLRLPIYTEDDPFPDSINPPPDYTNENKDEESQSIDSASDNQPLIV